MKAFIAILLMLFFPMQAMADWVASGAISNPTAGQVLVDSGPLPASARSATIIVSSTVAARFRFQWRSADNTTTVAEQYFFCPANGTIVLPPVLESQEFQMNDNERLRIIIDQTITGAVSVSLFRG